VIKVAIAQYTRSGELIGVFGTDREAAAKTGVPRASIQDHISGKAKHAGGFLWVKYSTHEMVLDRVSSRLEYYEEYQEYAIDDAWESLCLAIVKQAVIDYKAALEAGDDKEREDLLDFFYSEFVEIAAGLNPDELVFQIERIHNKENDTYES